MDAAAGRWSGAKGDEPGAGSRNVLAGDVVDEMDLQARIDDADANGEGVEGRARQSAGVLVSSEALAEFQRTLDMWHQHPQQPDVAFVERARLLAAKRQHRRGLGNAGHAADRMAAFMEPGEIGVEFAAEKVAFGDQLRAELRVSKVVAARFGKIAPGLGGVGVSRVEMRRIGELAAIGRHQEIAWPPGFAKVQQGPLGAENPADPAADIEPAAISGAGLIYGADAISKITLGVGHCP